MAKKRQDSGRSSAPHDDSENQTWDIKSIMKDMEFIGSPHMTWKQKKDLENKKVVSLGGKPPKKHKFPLSIARVMMKKQKEREEKMMQENEVLRRFGTYSSRDSKRSVEKRRSPEDMVFRTTEGSFRKGVLDVKDMLRNSTSRVTTDNHKLHTTGKGNQKKKGGKKGNGKRKGAGRKRH